MSAVWVTLHALGISAAYRRHELRSCALKAWRQVKRSVLYRRFHAVLYPAGFGDIAAFLKIGHKLLRVVVSNLFFNCFKER